MTIKNVLKEHRKKSKTVDEDEFWFLSDDEDTGKRVPRGKCFKKRKYMREEDFEKKYPKITKKLMTGVLSDTMESQDNPAKEMASTPGWYDKDYSDVTDECVFNMDNDSQMDEFKMLDSSDKEQRKEVKDPLGHTL
ncbi:hypothetical protein NDU88_001269 [Pleurodeles waltl]|uniref:Uncharacterized protein n=1 Tax=Pleurodeles waltl TaxID=8319 RepID=A0AAV7U9N7_PLEWA|nr:hypothetical protein NDU88_001269 [Pleurodeles waltl]